MNRQRIRGLAWLVTGIATLLACLTPDAAGAAQSAAPSSGRRLTTVGAIRVYPGFYHLQNVLLRGELAIEGTRTMLRADEQEIRVHLAEGVPIRDGPVDARGLMIDVGRLEPGDPRVSQIPGLEAANWPRPGEELIVQVSSVNETPAIAPVSVRAIAIEPWRYEGQTVTVTGNFRGRNLFGDLPGAPGRTRNDFVLRGTEGALWVTDLQPRGQGFDLDVNRRVDSDRWLEVTGTIARDKGLVTLRGTRVALSRRPDAEEQAEEAPPPPIPLLPVGVVFQSPSDGEIDVSRNGPIRIQFSSGLEERSLSGRIHLSYPGSPDAPAIPFKVNYDAAARAIQVTPATPFESFSTIRFELLDGVTGFNGAPVTPFTMMFSVGG